MRKVKAILITLVVLTLFSSCRSKKEVSETRVVDSIFVERIVKITPPRLNSLRIDSPCDSLGNLKPFMYSFGTGNDKTYLKGENNTIYLEQNLDSVKSVWEREKKVKKEYINITKTTTITKTPKWAWYSLIVSTLLLVWTFRKLIFRL